MTGTDLDAARAALRERDDLVRQEAAVQRQIDVTKSRFAVEHATYLREQGDVHELRRLTPSTILARLHGRYHDDLAREQAEADTARLRADSHERRLAELRAERARLRAGIARLADADHRFALALAAAEQSIPLSDPRAVEIARLTDEHTQLVYALRACRRAEDAGRRALAAVDAILARLNEAGVWSGVDAVSGTAADLLEWEAMDRARTIAEHAQRCIDEFLRLLDDESTAAVLPDIDTRWVLDVFFDGFLVDIIRHRRIEKAESRIAPIRSWLNTRTRAVAAEAAELEARLADLTRRRAAHH